MSKSSHMGKERITLERVHALTITKNRLYDELLVIIDRLANKDPEYRAKRKAFDVLEKQMDELLKKVDYHIRAQMRNEQ